MTAKEAKAYKNIEKWRKLSKTKRQLYGFKSVITEAAGSMAMEGEPISKSWLKKNAR